jgi:hypothetical protein
VEVTAGVAEVRKGAVVKVDGVAKVDVVVVAQIHITPALYKRIKECFFSSSVI